jgi:hypothetical protein
VGAQMTFLGLAGCRNQRRLGERERMAVTLVSVEFTKFDKIALAHGARRNP